MKLIGYCRVSSLSQKEGTSLEYQKAQIEAYATLYHHELADVLPDIETGSRLDRNNFWRVLYSVICAKCPPPEMPTDPKALITALETPCSCEIPQPVDGIIAYALDRVGRDSRHLLWLAFEYLDKRKKSLIVMNGLGKCDTTSPEGRYMFSQFAITAQYFRESLNHRAMQGQKLRAVNNGYACGRPPYGLRSVGKRKLVVDEEELQNLAIMRYLKESGVEKAMIADVMNRQGKLKRNGKPWNETSVYQVLKKEPTIMTWFKAGMGYNYVNFKEDPPGNLA